MISQSKHIHKVAQKPSKTLKTAGNCFDWTPDSWRMYDVNQQPIYENQNELKKILKVLKSVPALVSSEEVIEMKNQLNEVSEGRKFIIQIGDCAELFRECTEEFLTQKFQFFQSMGDLLSSKTKKQSLVIGRVCGQFTKPRSCDYEADGVKTYRGDLINSFDPNDREPEPQRLLQGLIWQQVSLGILRTYNQQSSKVWTSHECLHLDYESSLTRQFGKDYYNTTGHFLWIGERTRSIDQGHIQFASGIQNPLGVKVSSNSTEQELVDIFRKLSPSGAPERLTIIARIGNKKIKEFLPKLVEWKKNNNLRFLWMCDPMHGNTITKDGQKTRSMTDIKGELHSFFEILSQHNEIAGGIHLEATPLQVEECINKHIDPVNSNRYLSACDPRLNYVQTQEVIEHVCQLMNEFYS